MKQVSLLPSGVQTWHSQVLGSGGQHFVYASTLATYTHTQSAPHRPTRLQTAHARTITGLAWAPGSGNAYCTAGADMRVVRWTIDDSHEQASLTTTSIPMQIDWAGQPGVAEPVAVLIKPGTVVTWDPSLPAAAPAVGAAPITVGSHSVVDALKDAAITCIRWNHPSRSAVLACGRVDGSIWLYDAATKKVAQKIDTPSPNGKDGSSPDKLGEVTDIQWDPLSNQYLLVLYRLGFMILVDSESGQVLQEFARTIHEPQMLAFVPSSPGDFLSVNSQSATLTVWNVSQAKPKEVIKVDAQGSKKCGMLAVKLLNTTALPAPAPVIAPAPVPASNSAAAQAAAAAAAAAAAIPPSIPSPSGHKFILAYLDGSVGIYDLGHRALDFLTTPAHSETIFDVRFKPSSPDVLATASYDSRIKIWHVPTQTQTQELKGQSGVIYAVSWAPGSDEKEQRIASAGSEGDVCVWDVATGTVLQKSQHHTKPVYGLKWHPSDSELLLSTSSDNYAVLFTPSGKVLRKMKHPAALYGCDWSPFHPQTFATACHDGVVRVYDATKDGTKPQLELQGHVARAFSVVWSPLLQDRLASGSDDKTIRVWDVSSHGQLKDPIVLQGHTHNVRGLTWSTEVPWLLLSGSWDGTIRMWDIRDGKCLKVIDDHHADVYGLASHPARPFSFVSSSRDTSLRFWNTDDTLGAKIKLQAILADGLVQPSHLEQAALAMKPGTPLKLSGQAGAAMVGKQVRELKDLERYAKVFDFFTSVQGVKELWKLLEALVNNKPTDSSTTHRSLLHVNDVRPCATAAARKLHASKNASTVGVGKKSARIQAAAEAYLKLGQVREYCELQIELGVWDRALAVAPAASMSYWKLLQVRYGYHLQELGDSANAALAFLAAGETALLIHAQQDAHDDSGAFLSAVCDALGALPMLPPFEPEEEKKFAALVASKQAGASSSASANGAASSSSSSIPVDTTKLERDSVPVSDALRAVAEAQSAAYFAAAQPVLAACALLRVGDAMGCVQKLVLGNELLLALAVCRVLKLQFCDDVFLLTARIAEELGLYDDALKCLLSMRDPQSELVLLAARYVGPANKKSEFYIRAGIRSAEAWSEAAIQAQKDGKKEEALTAYVAAGLYEKALQVGCEYLRDALLQSSWSVEEVSILLRPLNSIPLTSLPPTKEGETLRNQFLLYSYYLGAQHAMFRGFSSVVAFLFDSCHGLIGKLTTVASSGVQAVTPSFPLPVSLLRLQEASYFQQSDPARALRLLNAMLGESNLNAKYKAAGAIMKKTVETIHATPAALAAQVVKAAKQPSKNLIIPSGSYLPSAGSAAKQVVSVITRTVVQGPRLCVDQPPASAAAVEAPPKGVAEGAANLAANYVSLSEALMLVKCTPFSPNHTGQRLKVFV